MECCIRKPKSIINQFPATFCCGCGLFWGVLFVAVIYAVILVDGALRGSPIQVMIMLFFLSPIAAIPVFPKCRGLRTFTFVQQWVVLILMIVALLAWIAAM